ncbi:MAG: ATP-binding protein [Terracidiphilus sp.]|jgi:signal transduction histidine kinase
MKSLYLEVFLVMVSTLSLSFLAFRAISDQMEQIAIDPVFDRFDELQLESARAAFDSGGSTALARYMTKLDDIFAGRHYFLDSHGIDLLSGENRSALLPPAPASKWRVQAHDHWILSHRSADGRYWFAAVGLRDRPHLWTFLPYYFLVAGATGLLCWVASAGVVSPIRRIAASIALFGQGNLSIRVHTRRQDEVGQLGRSFNQMAERLERLIVSERRLLGDISHELRSPLARLKFAVKLARTSADSRAALDRIERDVDRITSLVADIVEITFIEGDPAVQDTGVMRAGEIVDELIRDCKVEAEIRGCCIAVHGRLSGEVMGNHELLRRAVENVVRNAIRYSPERATIDVFITEDSCSAKIVVRDYGSGVPEDALTRIFDPFFRVEEARDATGGGSGLGLSIAKRAVQVHHGAIKAENASPGLRVEITIPLYKTPASKLLTSRCEPRMNRGA